MKKLLLPISIASFIFFSLILISSAKAQEDAKKSCYDTYLQCAGNCTTSCRTCTKTSTGYDICGTDPKCSGACITNCGDAKRACERQNGAVGQPLEVQPTPSSEPTSQPTSKPQNLPQEEKKLETPSSDQAISGESLLDKAPSDNDLKPAPLPEKAKKDPLTGVVTELKGNIDMQLADGTWVVVKEGDFIPNDAVIFAGYNAEVTVQFSNKLIYVVSPLSELSIHRFETDPMSYYQDVKLGTGEVRFKVWEGDLKTNMRVSTPNASASIVGTDVGLSYNKETGTSIWEIYDGKIEVENLANGVKKTISSSYGSPIKRLEVTKDGSMVEKVAIPKGGWGKFLALQKIKSWWWIIIVILAAFGGYWLYRKGFINLPAKRRR